MGKNICCKYGNTFLSAATYILWELLLSSLWFGKNIISWILMESCGCSVYISGNCSLWVKSYIFMFAEVLILQQSFCLGVMCTRHDLYSPWIEFSALKAAKDLHRALLCSWQAAWGAGNLLLICHRISVQEQNVQILG